MPDGRLSTRPPIASFTCPLCDATWVLRRNKRRRSTTASIRERIRNHAYNRHPELTCRELSLLADRAAEFATWEPATP